MGSYVRFTVRENIYNQIIEIIEHDTCRMDDIWDIKDRIALLNLLEEEYEEDKSRQNKLYAEWMEHLKMLEEHNPTDRLRFSEVSSILDDYDLCLSVREKFELTFRITEYIEECMNSTKP